MPTLAGFLLIFGQNGVLYLWGSEAGSVRVDPQKKWQYEKQNAFDPTMVHRRGAYRHDVFNLEAVVTPAEYQILIDKLTVSDTILLFYMHGNAQIQASVKLDKLPECPDDLHEYPGRVSFTLYADYVGTVPRGVDPRVLRCIDDHEFVIGDE